ncbi:MAG: transposase [Candidatus Competibacteraceae bacterium]|nr:transposase [Candidatus Competibacteraceae bacterium]
MLDKRGNSNTQERIDLLAGFIKQFGKISILGLLADREFVGEKWFNYLKNEGIDFIIRIKKNAKTTNSQGQEVPVQNLFLQETHVTDPERIKRLLIIPVITFCWAHRIGEWQHDSVKPIKVKKHLRFSKSIFKTGLDFIRNAIFNPTSLFNLAALFHFLDFNHFNSSS